MRGRLIFASSILGVVVLVSSPRSISAGSELGWVREDLFLTAYSYGPDSTALPGLEFEASVRVSNCLGSSLAGDGTNFSLTLSSPVDDLDQFFPYLEDPANTCVGPLGGLDGLYVLALGSWNHPLDERAFDCVTVGVRESTSESGRILLLSDSELQSGDLESLQEGFRDRRANLVLTNESGFEFILAISSNGSPTEKTWTFNFAVEECGSQARSPIDLSHYLNREEMALPSTR